MYIRNLFLMSLISQRQVFRNSIQCINNNSSVNVLLNVSQTKSELKINKQTRLPLSSVEGGKTYK